MPSISFTNISNNVQTSFLSPGKLGMRSPAHTLKPPLHSQRPDKVEISTSGREKLEQETGKPDLEFKENKNRTDKISKSQELSQEEKEAVEKLKRVDREVRTHEMAHKAAAGSFAKGAASFDYTIGPDGKKYAVGGHVNIDTSAVPNNPEATIRKAKAIRSAALAPANPSSQDRSVAASAVKMESKARIKLREEEDIKQDDVTQKKGAEQTTTSDNTILQSILKDNSYALNSTGSLLDTHV